jgi:hypothetical protein
MCLSSGWRLGLMALLAALLAAGCRKNEDDGGSGDGGQRRGWLGQGQPGTMGVRRAADRGQVQHDLSQLALFYLQYVQGPGKPTLEGFKDYIKRDAPNLVQALDQGLYVLIPTKNPNSSTVLAYEKAVDGYGQQLVAMGDRSVKTMTAQELQQALQNPGG